MLRDKFASLLWPRLAFIASTSRFLRSLESLLFSFGSSFPIYGSFTWMNQKQKAIIQPATIERD
jgi:hypothetical protein